MNGLRLATPADAAALAGLRWEFRSGLATPDEQREAFIARCAAWMAAAVATPAWRCWLVEEAGAIGGNLWLQVIAKVPNPVAEREAHAYITNVYVAPALRGRRLGERLMDAAMAWCRGNGIDSVILWPTTRSRSLYERHGFAVRGDLLVANLGERHLG